MPPVGRSHGPEVRDAPEIRDRFSALMPALIGLTGVLIGGLITGGITYLGDRAHRIADERTARRLIATEIRFDTNRLVLVSVYGRQIGAGPRTVEWESQASTLARYTPNGRWSVVSSFYDSLMNIEPSLLRSCVTVDTRRFATTVAKLGDAAYVALGNESIPSVAKTGTQVPCR
jgi:hypothetical protein